MLKFLILLTLSLHSCLAFDEYDLQQFDSDRFFRAQTPEKGCRKDILVIWDNSQSIGSDNFLNVRKFLKQLIVKLNVSPDGTRLGFITFSTKWPMTRKLLDVGEITDPIALSKHLDKYDYMADLMGDGTRTGKAFELANKMFSRDNPKNYRDDVDDVVLLFTDGHPNGDTEEAETKIADQEVERLKQKGIRIVCISAGKKEEVYDHTENLINWATDRSLVLLAGFEKLKIDENVRELVNKLENPLCGGVEPAHCGCKGGGLPRFNVFAQPGQTKTVVGWNESELVTCNSGSYEKGNADRTSGENFSLGKHSIIHRYWYDDSSGKRVNFQCTVNFTVSVCDCPPVRQVMTERLSGDNREASVTWNEPHPNCPATPSKNNPARHAGMFTAGEHTISYRYTVQNQNPFTLICRVKIIVPGEFCGDFVYEPGTHVCCCGKIYGKKPWDHKCCGNKYINSSKNMCCQGDRPITRPGPCPKI